jgi:penicillin-insensitive murein endopeptidase
MRTQILLITLSLLFLSGSLASADQVASTASIGSYTAGCIRNSAALPKDGKGYQVIRLGRGRYFAHPETIDYITALSANVKDELDGHLLIADISQQTGGPMPDDHSSHQTGLDADILFLQHPLVRERSLTLKERQYINPESVLTPDGDGIDPGKWGKVQEDIIKLAASDPRVDRIFINPLLKKKLCMSNGDQDWLGKVRPWYGHDGHFHVRLKCPRGSASCEPQKPLPSHTDGCGTELDTWFTADGRVKKRRKSGTYVWPKLPDECAEIMNGHY